MNVKWLRNDVKWAKDWVSIVTPLLSAVIAILGLLVALPRGRDNISAMRPLSGILLAISLACSAFAQTPKKSLADEIALSRTIIAKLDHAAQTDPPPNFASQIMVNVHKQAAEFMELADTTSDQLQKGEAPNATVLFLLYTEFCDLYDQYDGFITLSSKRIELEAARSKTTVEEFVDARAYLNAATLVEISKLDDAVHSCKSFKSK